MSYYKIIQKRIKIPCKVGVSIIKHNFGLEKKIYIEGEYEKCIEDLLQQDIIWTMQNFIQHSNRTCLDHSLYISYYCYLAAKREGLDYVSTARGALLHDFFLYDWHGPIPYKGLHAFNHPYIALENAKKYFTINEIEEDIIKKHMWPLTLRIPKYKETILVSAIDKYCSSKEVLYGIRRNLNNFLGNED